MRKISLIFVLLFGFQAIGQVVIKQSTDSQCYGTSVIYSLSDGAFAQWKMLDSSGKVSFWFDKISKYLYIQPSDPIYDPKRPANTVASLTLTATFTNNAGQSQTVSKLITMYPLPDPPTIKLSNNVFLIDIGNTKVSKDDSFQWWYTSESNVTSLVAENPIASIFTPLNNGTYWVVRKNVKYGCVSKISNKIIVTTLANRDFDLKRIAVYPNPVKDILHIDLETQLSGKISDLTGKTLMNVTNKNIDVSSLSTGIYLLDITSEGKRYFSKIVKE